MVKFVEWVFAILILMSVSIHSLGRSRRFLIFPKTSPTRIQVNAFFPYSIELYLKLNLCKSMNNLMVNLQQIITGVGLPVDLDLETVTIGYVFKCEFYIPDNVTEYTNFIADPFDVSTHPISSFNRKRRSFEEPEPTETPEKIGDVHKGFDSKLNERYESYQVEAEVIDSGTESIEKAEESFYNDISVPVDHIYNDDPMALNQRQNTKTSRWTLYKSMAIMAERFEALKVRNKEIESFC